MKKSLSLVLALCLVLMAFVGCTPTASQAPGTSGDPAGSTVAPPADAEPIHITILSSATQEQNVGIMRDLLIKNGFEVTLTLTPDTATSTAVRESGEWDLMLGGWTSVSGADYAVRSLFYTDAPFNRGGVADPDVDRLIDEAAAATIDESWDIYAELERVLVEENAYTIPMYANMGYLALNTDVMNGDTVQQYRSRPVGPFEMYEYNDTSLHETRPFVYTALTPEITSYWPPRHNDVTSGYFTSNAYIRLLNMDSDDMITTDSSLSYNYAIKEGNSEFYFILRDNVTYAKVENQDVVDTGIKVSAEDVLFSLGIGMDKDAVPDHRTYTLYEKIDTVSIVTDLSELDATSSEGGTLLEGLSADLPADISTLTDNIANVDNAGGTYQIVKVSTKGPFPQIVNYLAHMASGIYNKESVEEVMSIVDVPNYDPATDIIYGDRTALTLGDTYDNHVLFSGPYAVLYQDQYMGVLKKNPGYMPDTDYEPRIVNVQIKFNRQRESAASEFRSGALDMLTNVPEQLIEIIKADPQFRFEARPVPTVFYMTINMNEEFGRVVLDEDVRKAMLYSVDQNAYVLYYDNYKMPTYTTLTPLLPEAVNTLTADPNKVAEHLAAYYAKGA